MITKEESDNIERIQKIVLKIILGYRYSDYHQACIRLKVQNLRSRRVQLSLNFGLKCAESEKIKHLFTINPNNNLRNPNKFDLPMAKSSRYFNSPRLYITRLLNDHFRNNYFALQ